MRVCRPGLAKRPRREERIHKLSRRAQRHDLCFVWRMERTVNTAAYCIMVALGAYVCLFSLQRRAALVGILLILVAGGLAPAERYRPDYETERTD